MKTITKDLDNGQGHQEVIMNSKLAKRNVFESMFCFFHLTQNFNKNVSLYFEPTVLNLQFKSKLDQNLKCWVSVRLLERIETCYLKIECNIFQNMISVGINVKSSSLSLDIITNYLNIEFILLKKL